MKTKSSVVFSGTILEDHISYVLMIAHTHLYMAVHGGGMQCCPPAAHGHVDVGAALDEPFHEVKLPLARRLDQHRPTWGKVIN